MPLRQEQFPKGPATRPSQAYLNRRTSERQPKQSIFQKAGQVLGCAANTADKLSIAGILNIDQNAHPVLGTLVDAAAGNTFSGVVNVASSVARGPDRLAAGANALGQGVLGGATLGLPVGSKLGPLHGGVMGAATDAVVNAVAPSLKGTALAGGMSAAAVFGWGKLALDGTIFIGSMAFCAAQ